MALGPSEVHIWYRATESLDADAVTAAAATLSHDERARTERLRMSHDRRDYVIAHDLVRRSLSRYAPVSADAWVFSTDALGKPTIKDSTLSFSLSHTRGLVACAIADGYRVGVDVESSSGARDVDGLAERYFSPSEVASLRGCPKGERGLRFLELWTLKEAFLKAIGRGLSESLNAISIDFPDEHSMRFSLSGPFDPRDWYLASFAPSRQTRLAVAVCGKYLERPQFIARSPGNERESSLPPMRSSA
ncbi:MAG TPA: 4'-phosphopantetheinyl transferase superfamily protein [Vicinamibacterales bacterium]